MAITDETIFTATWSVIRSSLVGNVFTSNSVTGTTTPASVASTYNDETTSLPVVVINPIEDNQDTYKFGSVYGKHSINIIIDCYGKNTLYTDQLIQQVVNILSQNTIDGIELVGITTNTNFEPLNDSNKVFAHSVTFSYDRE